MELLLNCLLPLGQSHVRDGLKCCSRCSRVPIGAHSEVRVDELYGSSGILNWQFYAVLRSLDTGETVQRTPASFPTLAGCQDAHAGKPMPDQLSASPPTPPPLSWRYTLHTFGFVSPLLCLFLWVSVFMLSCALGSGPARVLSGGACQNGGQSTA